MPAEHGTHALDAITAEYIPTAHAVHTLDAFMLEYVPSTHCEHTVAPEFAVAVE